VSKILYVEDHPAQRDIMAQMLELSGYEVAVASDGIEGVEQAQSWNPDLILMDPDSMPSGNCEKGQIQPTFQSSPSPPGPAQNTKNGLWKLALTNTSPSRWTCPGY